MTHYILPKDRNETVLSSFNKPYIFVEKTRINDVWLTKIIIQEEVDGHFVDRIEKYVFRSIQEPVIDGADFS